MSVVEHDFGLEHRLMQRRFGKLLELDASHEANIRANPLPCLERASERMIRLQEAMFDAIQPAKPPTPGVESEKVVMLGKSEFQRLQKCLGLLENGFAQYGSQDEAP